MTQIHRPTPDEISALIAQMYKMRMSCANNGYAGMQALLEQAIPMLGALRDPAPFEWVPTSVRLPTEADATPKEKCVLAQTHQGPHWTTGWGNVSRKGHVAWARIPLYVPPETAEQRQVREDEETWKKIEADLFPPPGMATWPNFEESRQAELRGARRGVLAALAHARKTKESAK